MIPNLIFSRPDGIRLNRQFNEIYFNWRHLFQYILGDRGPPGGKLGEVWTK